MDVFNHLPLIAATLSKPVVDVDALPLGLTPATDVIPVDREHDTSDSTDIGYCVVA
uniref:Pheromone n=1 Tax=Lentinula edodes TaxID=5353 RepID=A0A2U9Q1X8_LENED|nr:Pheromone [Lentinula edodes]AWT58067.1 Pheromone [Lentinula edodes]